MNIRRLLAIFAVGAFLATGAACSSDSKDDKKSDKKESEQTKDDASTDDSDGSDDSDEAPATTVSNDEFSKQMSELSANIKAAGSDVCQLVDAAQANPPEPANEEQTKEFAEVWSQMLNAIAATIGGDNGKAMSKTAEDFKKFAASKNYSPSIFSDEELGKIMSNDDLNAAMEEFGEKSAKCFDSESSSGGLDDANG